MATKKTPSKKTAAPVEKTAAKKTAASAAKKPTKKTVAKKTVAKKTVAKKATGASTHEDAHLAENIWDHKHATTSTTNVTATVNGKVIYANDVKPAAVRKRFLSWFKR